MTICESIKIMINHLSFGFPRCLRCSFAALLFWTAWSSAPADTVLMTIGDSVTRGFPHGDGISYHSTLDTEVTDTLVFVGNPLDDPADGPAGAPAPMVGGDGNFISQRPLISGPSQPSVFRSNGMLERFEEIKDTVTPAPQFIIFMGGTNDLIQMIEPTGAAGTTVTYTPDTTDDFLTTGTFEVTAGMDVFTYPSSKLIDRYNEVLDMLNAAFPGAEIICMPLPPVDTEASGDAQFELAKATLATVIPDFNEEIEDLIATKGDRFHFIDHGLLVDDLTDGLHPTPGGYEKIGNALAPYINAGSPPEIDSNSIDDATIDEGTEHTFTATGSDPDSDEITFSLANAPAGAAITGGGEFSWTPSEAQGPGTYTFDIVLEDDSAETLATSAKITLTVDEVNVAPEWDTIAPFAIDELLQETRDFSAQASDADEPAQTLTFSLQDEPEGASITEEGVFTWTPSEDQGGTDYTVDLIVSDGVESDTITITITVNETDDLPLVIMTMGDTMTSGFPNDGVSYHTFLDTLLPIAPIYEGDPDPDTFSDSGDEMVGGPGYYISRNPEVGQSAVGSVFPNPGLLNAFESLFDPAGQITQTPDFVVLKVGFNDLMQLISPSDTLDTFEPDITDDFTAAGTYTDRDGGGNEVDRPVDAIKDRYGALMDAIAAQFPPSTKVICVALPPVDPEGTFPQDQFQNAKGELSTTVPDFNDDIEELVSEKGNRFAFLDPALTLNDIRSDGIHPTNEGHEKVAQAIAGFMVGNLPPKIAPAIGDQSVEELETLTFTVTAEDPDGDDVSYSLNGAPDGASIDADTGVFTWTPTAPQGPGTYTFDLVATDDAAQPRSGSETITVTVTGDTEGDLYAAWAATVFDTGDLADPTKEDTVWGPHADPDQDGWANEFEFYLLLDPSQFDEPDLTGTMDDDEYVVTFTKTAEAPLNWVDLEYSRNMTGWDSMDFQFDESEAVNGMQTVEARLPVSGEDRIFVRFAESTP